MATPRRKARTEPTSKRDELILRSLAELYCLTADQVARLHYGRSDNFVGRRLSEFAAGGVLAQQILSLPRMHGNRPYVYRLGNRGRRYLEALGAELPRRSHHSPNHPYKFVGLDHTLCVNDFLISLKLLCREDPRFSITQLVHERAFKRDHDRVQVQVGDGPVETISVEPDAWIALETPCGPLALVVEVDLDTEPQSRWRKKIRGLLAWFYSPAYERRFGQTRPLVPVVSIAEAERSVARRRNLQEWTEAELRTLKADRERERFLFTDQHPGATPPERFFGTPTWYRLGAEHPTALLDL